MTTPSWFPDALCYRKGREWHHMHWTAQLSMCRACPVIDSCWALAASSFETWSSEGTWAGTFVNEREAIGNWTAIAGTIPRRPKT